MEDSCQLDIFDDAPEANSGKVVIARRIDLGSFGNLCLIIEVDGSIVRAVTHLECADPAVKYYNYLS